MKYQPKKSAQHWLAGAPEYVLACYDQPFRWQDRYTILLGGEFYGPELGRNVQYLASTDFGSTYFGEMPSANRASCGKKVTWESLPQAVKDAIISRCENE